MEIILTKHTNRNMLLCKRIDGSFTSVNLGPDIPNHDIAHFVVEKQIKMKNGFYGKIKSGMSITELSDKDVIKNLGSETWLSEIMARNLQSLGSGAAYKSQYIELVNWEAENIKGVQVPYISEDDVEHMKSDFDKLCSKWMSLPENGELRLHFR